MPRKMCGLRTRRTLIKERPELPPIRRSIATLRGVETGLGAAEGLWHPTQALCDTCTAPTPRRDGGTGRRSGLKIRRPLRSWGFDPPSRHHQNKEIRLNWPLETREAKIEAKIVWWLFWWLLVSTRAKASWPLVQMAASLSALAICAHRESNKKSLQRLRVREAGLNEVAGATD